MGRRRAGLPSITVRLLRSLTTPAREPDRAAKTLSEREVEVVREIARGRTNLEIGAELFISLSTVKSHVSTIQTKLTLRNRTEIAVWAWENRIITAP